MQPLNGRNPCSWAQATLREYKCVIPLSALTSFIQQWRTVPIFLHLVHGLWELSFEIKSDQINLLAKLCLRVWQLMKEEDLDPPTTGLGATGYTRLFKFRQISIENATLPLYGPQVTPGYRGTVTLQNISVLQRPLPGLHWNSLLHKHGGYGVKRSECAQPGCGQWELVNRAGRKVHQKWIVLNKSLRTSPLIPEDYPCAKATV